MKRGTDILTNTGACQSGFLSAIFFIVYLAIAIKPLPPYIDRIDYNRISWSVLDRMINRDTHCIEIDPKYSGDINPIRSWYPKFNQAKRVIPKMLSEKGLVVNTSKTEEFEISRNCNHCWKNCKVLESLLDAEHDIKRRHGLTAATYDKLENIFKSHSTNQDTTLNVCNQYICWNYHPI